MRDSATLDLPPLRTGPGDDDGDGPRVGRPAVRNPITVRSVLLGLLGVVLICGLTPYNDYALNNTFLVGNNLPLGVVMLAFLFAVLVNGPLSKWKPSLALSSGELTVAFSMTLVSCALPSSGLMRYLAPTLVIPWFQAQSNAEFLGIVEDLGLARWLFPDMAGDGPRAWMNSPVVNQFAGRVPPGEPIPWAAWLAPIVGWGVFVGALYVALLCMVTLVRRQWYENERLPFPLAQIQLALVESPRAGRFFNDVFGRRSFWVAAVAIFGLHAWIGLARYQPRYFPEIWVYYDFNRIFTEPPWTYVDGKIKDAAVFFSAVGVTYFLTSSVAFSLWAFFILRQFARMYLGLATGDPTIYGQEDQHLGGVFALGAVMLWVGRHHWRLILAQAFRGERAGEPRGRYLSYPFAFWGMVGAAAVMVGWFVAAGGTLLGGIVVVLLLLLAFLIIARIIAETGLIHGQLQVPLHEPWVQAVIGGISRPVPLETFYLTAMIQAQHYDYREVVPVYASHGVKLADETTFADRPMDEDGRRERRIGRGFIALLMLALVVGYVVSFGSMLWTEYRHNWTKDVAAIRVNEWGANGNISWQVTGSTVSYAKEQYAPRHSFFGHFAGGFAFTSLLGFLRLRYTWWPLHPIGFIMTTTFPGHHLWFSIFVGWLCKVLIVRFTGASGYSAAKPFFIGLIIGESAAAGFWLVVGIVMSAMGMEYRPVNIMPG